MLHLNVLLEFLTTSPALPEAFRGTDTTKHRRCEVFRICMTNGNRGLDHNVFHIHTCMLMQWHKHMNRFIYTIRMIQHYSYKSVYFTHALEPGQTTGHNKKLSVHGARGIHNGQD